MKEERFNIDLDEWYEKYALEVALKSDKAFLLAIETLERIGILSSDGKTLYPSCHIFTKRGKYYITHFKELFALDGRGVNLSQDDIKRRNLIASLLEEWGIVEVLDKEEIKDKASLNSIKVVKYANKSEYNIVSKYQIGNKK